MKNLQHFIDEHINHWRKYQDKPAMSLPLSQEDVNEIAEDIDCRLSPENLHCDGEISNAEANRKFNYLNRVFRELKAHAKSQGLTMPKTWEIE